MFFYAQYIINIVDKFIISALVFRSIIYVIINIKSETDLSKKSYKLSQLPPTFGLFVNMRNSLTVINQGNYEL